MNKTHNDTLSGFNTVDYVADYVYYVFMVILILLTVVGNVYVIVAIFNYKPLRNVQNIFIVSLASADFAVAVLVMPLHVANAVSGKWLLGAELCDFWLTLDILLCTSSILNICAIAIDRYFAIHDPIDYARKRTIKRVLIIVALVWIISATISVPPLFGWGKKNYKTLYNPVTKTCHLSNDWGFVVYSACGSFYIPLAILSFVYLKIFLATKQRLRKRAMASKATQSALLKGAQNKLSVTVDQVSEVSTGVEENRRETTNNNANGDIRTESEENSNKGMANFFQQKQNISLSKERKAARTLGVIMGAFILCWLPFFILYILSPFCNGCSGSKLESVFVWLGYINSALNPFIYTVFNIEFRRAFKYLCLKHFICFTTSNHPRVIKTVQIPLL